jgi:hypothetical protein
MILYVRANLVYKGSDYLQDKSMFTVIIKKLFSQCLVRLYQNYEKPCHSQTYMSNLKLEFKYSSIQSLQ